MAKSKRSTPACDHLHLDVMASPQAWGTTPGAPLVAWQIKVAVRCRYCGVGFRFLDIKPDNDIARDDAAGQVVAAVVLPIAPDPAVPPWDDPLDPVAPPAGNA